MKKLINKHRTAAMLDCSLRTLFNLRKSKEIFGYRITNTVKYDFFEIKKFVNERRIGNENR